MELGVLGPLEVRVGGRDVEIGSPKLRTLLLLLILDAGRAVSVDRLVDDLWAGDPPSQALVSLRSYVSNLRKLFVSAGAEAAVLQTKGKGYALVIPPEQVDAVRFERLVTEARKRLQRGDASSALTMLEDAEDLWRGEALADVRYEDFAQAHIARLEELRLTALEDRIDALLATGRHLDALPALEATVSVHPLRERPHAQLMLALHRAARSPDALDLYRAFRSRLVEELGLEPSPSLAGLSDAIARRSPELDLAASPLDGSGHDLLILPRTRPELVGRDEERGTVQAAVDRLTEGHGGVLLIAGEAGIGKSSMMEQLVATAATRGVSSHWSRCDETDGAPAFWPWLQLVRSVAARMSDEELRVALGDVARPVTQLAAELAERVGERVTAAGADPESARFALYEAVTTFLVRSASDTGSVLVIDDLHWADTTSLQLLSFLAARLAGSRLLIGVTHRVLPADRSPELDAALAAVMRSAPIDSLNLQGLTPGDVGAVLSELTGVDASTDIAAEVHDRSGGNPFFVRQLAKLITETQGGDEGTGVLRIPTGVRHVILRRLQLLPAETRRTLDAAAVAGRDFDLRVVAAALGRDVDAVLDDVDLAVAHGLLSDAHEHALTYRFSHALLNETIYHEIPPGRAARLHAAVGSALEERGQAGALDLAEHFWRAADLIDDDRPITYMRAAADEALEMLAYEQGESLLRRVLHLLSHRPDRDLATELEVRLRLVQLLTSVQGWTADQIHELAGPTREMALETGITSRLVPLWWSLWTHYTTRGDMVTSRDLAHTLRTAAERNPRGACHVAANVAMAYSNLHGDGDDEAALALIVEAREAEARADPELLASTPEHLSISLRVTESLGLAHAGASDRSLQVADEAIDLAKRVGGPFIEAYARLFAGWSAAVVGEPSAALQYTDRGLQICDEFGFVYVAILTTPVDGWARARLGDDRSVQVQRMRQAIDSLLEVSHHHAAAQWLLLLADVNLLSDDVEAAAAVLAEARAVLTETGERFYGPQLAALDARLATRRVPS